MIVAKAAMVASASMKTDAPLDQHLESPGLAVIPEPSYHIPVTSHSKYLSTFSSPFNRIL